MQGLRSIVSLSLILGFLGVGGLGWAQAPPQTPTQQLPRLEYDVARKGPLLMVIGGSVSAPNYHQLPPEQQEALAARLDSYRQRVVVGGLTVVVPQTMQVIETKPGKPNPFADLSAQERLQVLLSYFDAAQWALAGSAQGIGLADMSDIEQALYLSLLPNKIAAEHFKLVPGDQPRQLLYVPENDTQECDPLEVRLRLVRKTRFEFSKQNTNDFGYTGFGESEAGDEITRLTEGDQPRGDNKPASETILVFGVPLIRVVPNRLKPGDLDFTDPKLRQPIALEGDLQTLGDLLKRVGTATGMDLMADRRVAGLPLLVRSLPGQQVRGADILKALCWSMTGAFRRVGDSTYLLTDDVEGLGARFGRLEEWAAAAGSRRGEVMDNAREAPVPHNPLSYIGFAPGDPNSLPPDLTQRIDDLYRKGEGGKDPVFQVMDLPAALQHSVMQKAAVWEKLGTSIRTDQISLVMEMSAQYVLPGGMAATPRFADNLGWGYLRSIAAHRRPARPTSTDARTVPPQLMSEEISKRVLLAQLPAEDPALMTLLYSAKSKGFTEVWLHVRLDDLQAPERLNRAQVKGRKLGLVIGGAVSLLRGGGMPGTEDSNILGETGAAFVKRRVAAAPQYRSDYTPYSGWTLFSPDQAVQLLTPLAQVPGLSALALKASAAPGWAGYLSTGDGIPNNVELGFGLATRLACLRAEGFDPIDVDSYPGPAEAGLRFFPHTHADGLSKSLHDFRLRQNQQSLEQVHSALRKLAPQLSLFLDDRASPYTDPDTCWFGRWDDPHCIAINPLFHVESVAREAAFASSPEPLLLCQPWSNRPGALAKALYETAQRALKTWPGIALDLTQYPPTDALHQLSGLPDMPAHPR